MHPTKTCFLSGMTSLALTLFGCSSDEPEAKYAQPAASVGDEASPAESSPPVIAAEPAATPTPAPMPVPEPVAEAAAPLSDAQIAKVTTLVNNGEIEQAQLARTKSKNAAVKKFAAAMIKQHTQANQKGAQLAKKAQLTPADSPVAMELEGKATATLEELKSTDAASFDSAYIAAQVSQHQEVLDLLDDALIPAATHPELKTELEATRTMVQHHLSDAQAVQAGLASPSS